MVSWQIEVEFLALSPHIKELVKLAKQEGFSNIEKIEYRFAKKTHLLTVNDRGLDQIEFKCEKKR